MQRWAEVPVLELVDLALERKYYIGPEGLCALFRKEDPKIVGIVRSIHEKAVPVHTSDLCIQVFLKGLTDDKKDVTRIKSELKRIQLSSGFKLVEPLTMEEFTDAKVLFERLDNDGLTLLQWTILHSMARNGCNVLITTEDYARGLHNMPKEVVGEFLRIEFLPKFIKRPVPHP
jgi:predicted nucleic acid-binding protein